MANIQQYLSAILEAVYGEEVRNAIHDAIKEISEESAQAKKAAESKDTYVLPRATSDTLGGVKLSEEFTTDFYGRLIESASKKLQRQTMTTNSIMEFLRLKINDAIDNPKIGMLYPFSTYQVSSTENTELFEALGSSCTFANVISAHNFVSDESSDVKNGFQLAFPGDGPKTIAAYRYYTDSKWSHWETIGGAGSSDDLEWLGEALTDFNNRIESVEESLGALGDELDASKITAKDKLNNNVLSTVQTVLDNLAEVVSDSSDTSGGPLVGMLGIGDYTIEMTLLNGTKLSVVEKFTDDGIEYLVVRCVEGDKISVAFENTNDYEYGDVIFSDYDFSRHTLNDCYNISLKKCSSFSCTPKDSEVEAGYSTVSGKVFTATAGKGSDFEVNAVLIPYRDTRDETFDYTGAYLIAKGDDVRILRKYESSSLKKLSYVRGPLNIPIPIELKYSLVDKKARDITDRFKVDSNGNLLFDGRRIQFTGGVVMSETTDK